MSDQQKVMFEIVLDNGEFKVRAKESADALGKIGDKAQKSEGAFSKLKSSWVATAAVAASVIYAFTKVGQAMGECVEYASKLQETQNKFNVVFKNSKEQAKSFAKTLVDSYGLANEEAMAFLAGTGDILTGLGMQSDKALELSNTVAQLGIDLASFSNVEGGNERAIAALTSSLTGEREALKAYGIVVSEEMIKAELVAQNKSKLTGLSLQQAKAEATLAIALSQSGNAIGDMARSFNSYANIQRRVDSAIVNQKAALGEGLIPALSGLGLVFLEASKDGGVFWGALKGITKAVEKLINGLAVLLNLMEYASQKGKKAGAESFIKTGKEGFAKKLKEIDNYYGEQAKVFGVSSYKFMMEKAKAGDETAKRYINELAQIKKDVEQAEKDAFGFDSKANKISENWTGTKDLDSSSPDNKTPKPVVTPVVPPGEGKDKEKIPTPEEQYYTGVGITSGLNNQLSELYAMNTANHNAEIDNRTQKQLEAINTAYEAEKAAIENSLISEEQKTAKLKALDEKRARDEKAVQEKADKEKRKLARDSAIMQKKLAIADVLINTPAAALQTFRAIAMPHQPWTVPLAYIAAGATAAFGAAKLKLINETPLPSYAVGTWAVPSDMTAQIHKDEMIIPKTFSDSVRKGEASIGSGGGGITIIVQGSIIDKDGFAQSVNEALMDVQRRTGVSIYSRKSVY